MDGYKPKEPGTSMLKKHESEISKDGRDGLTASMQVIPHQSKTYCIFGSTKIAGRLPHQPAHQLEALKNKR